MNCPECGAYIHSDSPPEIDIQWRISQHDMSLDMRALIAKARRLTTESARNPNDEMLDVEADMAWDDITGMLNELEVLRSDVE